MDYAEYLHMCGIQTPDTLHFSLPNGLAAFATRRFDRHDGLRVPMQRLAAFTGADYKTAGTLDYVNFLRATQMCTNDLWEKALAYERTVFRDGFIKAAECAARYSSRSSSSLYETVSYRCHRERLPYFNRPDRNCPSRSLFGLTRISCGCPSSSIFP
ncbi:hypothetical protein [Burkholderia ubonensis]|uniref:hypothetical protein n=1 Tax=Burkholderia ubonensis TaxID=101571 RepID=UPI003F753515